MGDAKVFVRDTVARVIYYLRKMKKTLIVLTGAGMSAESGIKTFRDSNGLWENHDVMEVCSVEGWRRNKALVLEFYNQRRKQLFEVKPNEGHRTLAALEEDYEVHIITQNVDDLHERAGSKQVLHLHGELKKVRSCGNADLIYERDASSWEVKLGELCEEGHQLRPHIVWFGEDVPLMDEAIRLVKQADVFLVIGTSLNVYPAAGLLDFVPAVVPRFFIDPHEGMSDVRSRGFIHIQEKACSGVKKAILLIKEAGI